MRSPLFWKLFASFLLTAVLINQSTWILYLYWYEPGPSWERMESEQFATVELAAARLAVERDGVAGFDRLRAALPAEHRGSLRIDTTATQRATRDVRVADAVMPSGQRVKVVYALKGVAVRSYTLLDILYRSVDYLIASLLGGALFAAALAWYLTRPIQRIRDGFGALASGQLDTRLAPRIGRRSDEFADLARDFDHMAERLQQLVGMRDQLLHDVSHELRSPLARMNVAIGLHRQGHAPAGVSLDRIEAEARRLDELVGELLSLARAESNAAEMDSYFDLPALVEAVTANVRFEAGAMGVDVRTVMRADAAIVQGNPELMRRAVENLLRNAVAASKPGDVVTATVQRTGTDACEIWEILVEDSGPGVSADQLEAIFDPFVRVKGGAGSQMGYGLGLAIARRAVSALGGSIRARNRSPHGLSVAISVPMVSMAVNGDLGTVDL